MKLIRENRDPSIEKNNSIKNIDRKVKKFLLSFTYQEQRKKELKNFKKSKKKLKDMSTDELDLEYFKYRAEHEHRKMMLPIFFISILASIVMNLWKYFYIFIEGILKCSSLQLETNDIEIAQMIIIVFSILIVFITICVFIFIIRYVRRIDILSKKLLLIENVIDSKEC